jgi:hypothetical protein
VRENDLVLKWIGGYVTAKAARAKFGEAGYYRIAALLDPTVRRAAQQFDRASAILAKAP